MAEQLPKDPEAMSEDDWRRELTPEQFRVLRQHGTERAFTGELLEQKGDGTYVCAGCGEPLFEADTKFESGTGWPSFSDTIDDAVEEQRDASHGMVRTEVHCRRCGGHLGHVFPDGPAPTGQRYCVNSVSLDFQPADD